MNADRETQSLIVSDSAFRKEGDLQPTRLTQHYWITKGRSTVFKDVEKRLIEEGLVARIRSETTDVFSISPEEASGESERISEVSFIDDVNLAVFSAAWTLLDRAQLTMAIIEDTTSNKYGLTTNFKAGKTNGSACFVGKYSKRIAATLALGTYSKYLQQTNDSGSF